MNGPLIGEALNVLFVTTRALLLWIAAGALAFTTVFLGTLALLTWCIRRLWRRTPGPAWARSRRSARAYAARKHANPEFQEAA